MTMKLQELRRDVENDWEKESQFLEMHRTPAFRAKRRAFKSDFKEKMVRRRRRATKESMSLTSCRSRFFVTTILFEETIYMYELQSQGQLDFRLRYGINQTFDVPIATSKSNSNSLPLLAVIAPSVTIIDILIVT